MHFGETVTIGEQVQCSVRIGHEALIAEFNCIIYGAFLKKYDQFRYKCIVYDSLILISILHQI
ncbi:hypothetical protein DLM46_23810 [Paraburkholderia lacunae]|uniref:Uncharacterized protein n=1 Tax=Paraburkholderia lacunae TaxID=2211104 RepID=A0A370N3Z6_9BURK|nr:hypothetical protein DLM46_23810 [Paraburkholderia lacunae]